MDKAFQYADQTEAHLDEGGTIDNRKPMRLRPLNAQETTMETNTILELREIGRIEDFVQRVHPKNNTKAGALAWDISRYLGEALGESCVVKSSLERDNA